MGINHEAESCLREQGQVKIQIVRAQPSDAETLTVVAHAAKRYWGYPDRWIEAWTEDLTVTARFIVENEVFLAERGDEVIGFYALSVKDNKAELEHLWVAPEGMRSGVGRKLFGHAINRASSLGATAIEITSDPNAEGFYLKMGAGRVGDVVSEIEGKGRVLPRLIFDISRKHDDGLR
jgi:GNAT superfamily N-acetyltransferase